jgi:hypothetical protein
MWKQESNVPKIKRKTLFFPLIFATNFFWYLLSLYKGEEKFCGKGYRARNVPGAITEQSYLPLPYFQHSNPAV